MAKGIIVSAKQKKIILYAVISLLFLYIDILFILKPQIKNLKNMSSNLRKLQSNLSQYRKDYGNFKNLAADYDNLKTKNADVIERQIFSDSDLPLLLDSISEKANSQGIKIMHINPQTTYSDKDKDIEIEGFKFHPLFIKLELRCGYHMLGKFLSQIEDNPLIKVADLKIDYDSASSLKQQVELIIRCYVNKK